MVYGRRDGKGWHRKIKQQNGVRKISTLIYYYSATGNSLYVARELQKAVNDVEIRSIVEAMQEDKPQVNAECVGFVFPMHYFGLPLQVEEFLQKLTILESPYIFAIATCGVPYWGRPFVDAEKILKEKNRQIHAAWYVRLVSNYIPLRDIAADWRIKYIHEVITLTKYSNEFKEEAVKRVLGGVPASQVAREIGVNVHGRPDT